MIKYIKYFVLILHLNLFSQPVDSTLINNSKVDSLSAQPKKEFVNDGTKNSDKPSKKINTIKIIPDKKETESFALNFDINFGTILYILILFLVGYFLTKLITLSQKLSIYKNYPFLISLQIYVKVFLWIIILYLIVTSLASQISFILLLLVLIALTIFSASSIKFLQSIIGGLYLNITNPFQKGDYIRINNFEGEVQKIELRTTTILTESNSMISIPNSLFLSEPVVNVNRGQVEQLLTISYEFPFEYSPNKITKVLYEAALSSPYTLSRFKPKVFYTKSDYKKQMRVFEIQVFVFDGKYENEMINNLNIMISKSLEILYGKQK